MMWEIWAERVPIDSYRIRVHRVSVAEFREHIESRLDLRNLTGIPEIACIDPYAGLNVWPLPEPGWTVKAYNNNLRMMITYKPVEPDGPW